MPALTSIAIGGAALAGGTAGILASGDKTVTQSLLLANPTEREINAGHRAKLSERSLFAALTGGEGGGVAGQALQGFRGGQQSFIERLQGLSQTGFRPTQQDIGFGRDVAGQLFGEQREALSQSFEDQTTQSQRLRAQLGRSQDDPILQAKLRTGFIRQQALLGARQGGFAQQLALQQPRERLGLAGQAVQAQGSFARQARTGLTRSVRHASGLALTAYSETELY